MPNTLEQLNDFSNDVGISYEDPRDYSITFSANSASNQSVTVVEDAIHTVPPGINITSVLAQPESPPITYTLDFSGTDYANLILDWPTLPPSVSYANVGNGVYRVQGYVDENVWQVIRSPEVTIKDRTSNYSYTADIGYPAPADPANVSNWFWNVSVTVSNSSGEISTPGSITYNEDEAFLVTSNPLIIDAYSGNLPYTLTVTPNTTAAVQTISSVGSANSTYNLGLRQLTLVGTKSEVNTNLANITVQPYADFASNFALNYSLTNPVSNLITQVTQQVGIANTNSELTATTNFTWDEDVPFTITGYPTIDDPYPHTAPWLLTMVPNVASAVGNITTIGSANSEFYTANGALVLTGTSTAINTNLANISVIPGADYDQTYTLTYSLTNPISGTVTQRTQQAQIGNTHGDYSLTTSYIVDENASTDLVWSVDDQSRPAADAFTVTWTQLLPTPGVIQDGRFAVNGTPLAFGASAVLTGNRVTVNANDVVYYPPPDYESNVTLTYTQVRNDPVLGNIVQANAVPVLLAIGNTYNPYSLTTNQGYYENYDNALQWSITDLDRYDATFTVTFDQTSANAGTFRVDDVETAAPVVLSGTKAEVNAKTVTWRPGVFGNTETLTYTQTREDIQGNITQANAVTITLPFIAFTTRAPLATLTWQEDVPYALTDFEMLDAPDGRILTWQGQADHGDWLYANGVSIGKTMTITDTAANIDTTISSRSWLPGADETTAANITVTLTDITNGQVYYTDQSWPNTNVGTHADFSVLTGPVRREIRDQQSLADYQVGDLRPNGEYTVTIADTAGTGNFWVDGEAILGNTITLTGNRTTINTSLSNVSTYWQRVRDTSISPGGTIEPAKNTFAWGPTFSPGDFANTTFSTTIQRNSPNATVFVSGNVCTVEQGIRTFNDYQPTLGNLVGNLFQGGYPLSQTSLIANTLQIWHPGVNTAPNSTSSTSITTSDSNLLRQGHFVTVGVTSPTPSAGATFGYIATQSLDNLGTFPANSLPPANAAITSATNGFNDWYLPKLQEINDFANTSPSNTLYARYTNNAPPSGTFNVWLSEANSTVTYWQVGAANSIQTVAYADLRTGTANVVASTMPLRRTYTRNEFYRAPFTGNATVGFSTSTYNFPNFNVGRLDQTDTFTLDIGVAVGNLSYAGNVAGNLTIGNLYSGMTVGTTSTTLGVNGPSQLTWSMPNDPGTVHNATFTLTRDRDGFVVEPNGVIAVTF